MQTIFSGLCLAAFASAAASSKIRWGPCPKGEFTTTVAVQCGTLRVPLDYTQPNSRKTLDLEIVKIPAAVQPSRGSIQLNFGGPGVPTRQDAPKMRTSGPTLIYDPVENYMSYTSDACMGRFTDGQRVRMWAVFDKYRKAETRG